VAVGVAKVGGTGLVVATASVDVAVAVEGGTVDASEPVVARSGFVVLVDVDDSVGVDVVAGDTVVESAVGGVDDGATVNSVGPRGAGPLATVAAAVAVAATSPSPVAASMPPAQAAHSTTTAADIGSGRRGNLRVKGYEAAWRRGSFQFGRTKWQVYPFGIRCR
jgi:hypothetical protein